MILRFNEDIVKQGEALHPSAYLFNLYRREPEPLEDARYSDLPAESRLFLADDVAQFKAYLQELVPHKAKNDVLFRRRLPSSSSAYPYLVSPRTHH
jgi:hypothetical protein